MQRVSWFCLVFLCLVDATGRYSKLHILDLNWEQCDTFVDFVESIVRANSISKQKAKQYRSSNLLELCSLLDENKHPPLQLVQGDHALWSLTFGIAQVDEIESPFVRIFTLRDDLKSNFPVIKLAEAVISIMRQMFPLPVALISTIAPTPSSPSLHESVLKDLEGWLNSIAPFCLWSMRLQMENFEIRVHVCNDPESTKKLEPREIKFVLKGVVGDTLELQNTISNRLHQEYGIPSIAFVEAPDKADSRHASVGQDSTQDTKPGPFLEAIWSSCLQSTKVLLKIADKSPSTPAKEVFLLEQVLNDFSVYREVVADFFLALKDELQQRIHGEDADELCRTTYERIKCSSPVSLPLYFFRMQSKSLQRVIKYLPDFFLCSNHVVEAEFSCLQSGLIQQESASIIVQQYEHDYDFPVFHSTEREELIQQAWTTYFEYLYLNCGDDRPYSPCWDPIALQEKAARVFEVISSTQPNKFLYKKKLTDVYDSFRTAVIENLKRKIWRGNNETTTIWECIQETKGYTFHDTIVLLNRLECGLKKVFYFLFCCKSIVFCEGCMKEFGLNPKSDAKQPYALKCSNYGSKFCQIRTKLKYPSYNGTLDTRNSSALKEFCFNWYIKVGLNLKKACSTALLRQHALPEDAGENAEKRPQGINFSYSRDKLGVPKMQNDERSKLRNVFVDVVEHCRSESLMLLEEGSDKQKSQILDLITIADSVNRVVAECDLLKTGCSVYERFPKVDPIGVNSTDSGSNRLPTHLIVAAVEGNAAKASAYIARADLDYISNLCMNTNDHDARRFGDAYVSSCALHLALERGNTDVANIIISRIASLACEEYFDWYPDPKKSKEIFLDRLFIGTSPGTTGAQIYRDTDNNQEIPTNFMYLARYAMIPAMDTVLNILGRLKKAEAIQTDISKYIVKQYDSNGLNALHYAVLSQSPQCVSWFLPYMHDFLVCHSSSKLTFCPELFGKKKPKKKNTLVFESFKSGYMKLLRMHPPSDFTDSDCRLSISEDWIQTYHFSHDGNLGLDKKSDASRNHQEMSPYELALLVWRLADVESALLQESLHNIATNVQKLKQESDSPKTEEAQGCMRCKKTNSVAASGDVQAKNSESVYVAGRADSVADSKKASADEDDALPERLAESYKQRSTALYKILTNLEEAAEAEVDIDAKKKKGLKQLAAYRNHRAMSRLVFPGMSYLIYVFFATLMAIIMTNGLFDEPAKFTHAVVAELGGAVKISNYNDLTVFWKTLAGFLWGSSPMALRFGEERNVCPHVLFAFHSL
jgi:hypothetical protein